MSEFQVHMSITVHTSNARPLTSTDRPGRTFTRLLLSLTFDTTRHARNSVVPSPLREVINTSIVDLALFRHHHRPRHRHRTRTT
ncbi:hypothetical protein R3P38DRAFT_3222386 [Favolaschia claudopus]|uniref:Uncharacterized protein n=1 Tax=Favolaschia claudopus TaxID=2862362 RepID=A0AAV9ZYW8_9AGAR